MYLHGRIAAGTNSQEEIPFKITSIPQRYVTTISFLLATVFRAALVASIGVCYAQYLWMVLRRQALEVSLIEELFQIHANALRLFNPVILRYAPNLLLLATISWSIPLATTFPPGAMIVDLETRQLQQEFNVSVIPQQGVLGNRVDAPRELATGPYNNFADLLGGYVGGTLLSNDLAYFTYA